MNKTVVLLLVVLLNLIIGTTINAEKVFTREILYSSQKEETPEQKRENAITEIKRTVLDEMGSYIVSQSQLNRSETDNGYDESFVQKTQSLSVQYMKVLVEKEEDRGDGLYLKVRIEVDDEKLDKELEDAGFSGKKQFLQAIIALMESNNVGVYNFHVMESAQAIFSGYSNIENNESGTVIQQVMIKANGCIEDGKNILNGKYEVLYYSGYHSFINIEKGFLEKEYKGYNSQGELLYEGMFSKGCKEGIWKEYVNSKLFCQLSFSNGYLDGKSSWYDDKSDVPYQEIEYKKGIPLRVFVVDKEGGSTIIREGAVDKYGEWQGERLSKDKEGNILEKATYENGKLHGEFFSYYSNGQINKHATYENEVPVGLMEVYYRNGNKKIVNEYQKGIEKPVKRETYFENGQPEEKLVPLSDGHFKIETYYESGTIKMVKSYVGDYKREGLYQSYYENGQLKEESNVVNNQNIGECKSFNEDGSPYEWMTYKLVDGRSVLDGIKKRWMNGYLYSEESYKDGVKDGLFRSYYTHSDQVKKSEEYKDGKYDGFVREYFDNGDLSSEEKYANGKKDGEWFSMNKLGDQNRWVYKDDKLVSSVYTMRDGKKKEEEYPLNGENGVLRNYYSNGQLQQEHFVEGYVNDRISKIKNGSDKTYYEDGTLKYDKQWEHGKEIGLSKAYDKKGKPGSMTYYVKGKRDGKSVEFEDGAVKNSGSYKNDKRNGLWYAFNSNGTVKKSIFDQYGREGNKEIIEDPNEISKIRNLILEDWSDVIK